MPEESTESVGERGAVAAGAPGYRIALILLGIVITPVVLSSPTLGSGLTLPLAVSAILVGSAILLALAVTTVSIGEHARQPTYEIVRFSFGAQGAKAITVLLAVSLFGWTAVTANGFGLAARSFLQEVAGVDVPLPVLVVLGTVIFVASTAFGFEVLGRVAQFAVPVIALILGFIVFQALRSGLAMLDPADPLRWGVAVSAVVGTAIVLVVTAADFGSFARSRRQAVLGAVLAFGVAYPLLYIAGALPSGLTGESSLIDATAVIASALPAIALLIFASITANAGNMFQGTLAVSTLLTSVRKWRITVAIGIGAAVVGSLDIAAWLPTFLLFLGIAAPPVAGIYIADFFLHRRAGYDSGLLATLPAVRLLTFGAWLVGSVVGGLTAYDVLTLTGIPSIDSMLVSALLYVLASRLTRRGTAARAHPTAAGA
ncbi:cytosine permease [Blastococcus sp. BMG 814]|uniref:Cytosine permease n=1 Tax=Blastococcus carthaginiensis TaxID=3050034 RepID=A0ABT9I8P9_9ACTN|nr:cytosine permease [Blastococcus carthaginiensis]MDP5181939.1 cytosine permease [Blastococcus carthaginiensis]